LPDRSPSSVLVWGLCVVGALFFAAVLLEVWRARARHRQKALDEAAVLPPASMPTASPACLGCGLPKTLRYPEPRVVETRDDPAPGWMDSIADWQGYTPKGARHVVLTTGQPPCLCDTCYPVARSICETLITSILADRATASTTEAQRVSDHGAFGLRASLRSATEEQRKQRQTVVGKTT
jgi:hypothetical protein